MKYQYLNAYSNSLGLESRAPKSRAPESRAPKPRTYENKPDFSKDQHMLQSRAPKPR